jgi:polygalacturonase
MAGGWPGTMSESGEPEGDRLAPGPEPESTADGSDKQHRAFVVPSWLGAVAERVSGPIGALVRRKPPVRSGRDPLRQRRLVVVTFLACLATLAGSIAASTQLSGASVGSIKAVDGGIRTGGTGTHTSSPGPRNHDAGRNTSGPTPETSSSGTNTSGPGEGSYSSFSCSASGSTATTRVTVTGLRSNGSGDDFAAIQNAINMAGQHGGGIVVLPAGTFVIDGHLTLRNNVELTGVGPATVIKAGQGFLSTQGPGGGYSLISTAGASNTTIADLTADQSGDTLDGNVPARLAGYVVEGYSSNNVVVDGVYVRNPFTYSIAMVRSTNFCVENCNVKVTTGNLYNQLDGIHVLDSNTGRIINNVVQSEDDGLVAHTIGAPVYNVLYANNDVYGGRIADGMQLAVGDFSIHNIVIEDNNFYGSQFGVRTGYYDNRTGAVYDIVIRGNYIHNLSQGLLFPAIEIGGFGGLGSITNVTIANNRACAAGIVAVQPGPSNTVADTSGCYAPNR